MSAVTADIDRQFMGRAIRLAMNGRGRVEPNPMVGCVIVNEGRVIGGGYHEQFGGPHAEPNALASCIESPAGATAYVTLEPCCHTDKKTPPCVPKLIEANLGRVVVGCTDPNPAVNGRGLAMLREAGIEVTAGVMEAECKQLIAPFIARVVHRRPYVTLKWAETADGKVAGPGGKRLAITNARSNEFVQKLRSRSEAIAVGVNTVLTDDPLLTVRGEWAKASRQVLRVVLDTRLRADAGRKIFAEEGTRVRAYHGTGGLAGQIRELSMAGVELGAVPVGADGHVSLAAVVGDLFEESITHLMVEAGPTLAAGFFRENLCDRVWVFRSTMRVEDESAPAAASIPAGFMKSAEVELGGDVLAEYLNSSSPVFFANEGSADLIL